MLRKAPCQFGLYTVIALWYAELPDKWQNQQVLRYSHKRVVAFSDALTAVRRWFWEEWIFATPKHREAFAKIPPRLRNALLQAIAPAA